MDRTDLASGLRRLGSDVDPQLIAATAALIAPLHSMTLPADVRIARDERYGTDARHRLDLFAPATDGVRPVLVFVHGGGFTGGDKTIPNTPFFDNVGLWAVRNGLIGVTMTYRLAPQHTWPAGSDDVAAATRWIRDNVVRFGGDSRRVFLMGQSAGALHVAGYIAREFGESAARPHADWSPAGAVLVSGLYDTDTMERGAPFRAYFGGDDASLHGVSFLAGLAGTAVPLFVAVAEWDPPDFQMQFARLLEARVRRGLPTRFVQCAEHNHVSPAWCMNTELDTLGPEIGSFLLPRGSA